MTTEDYTFDLPRRTWKRLAVSELGLTAEQIWNFPILLYFPLNGIFHLPEGVAKPIEAALTLSFGLAVLSLLIRNRFYVHWELWTCRILALMTLETVCSVLWSVQPRLTLIYPCAVSVLVFFYLNYLLSRFSAYEITRMMLWVFGIEVALSVFVSVAIPSIGIDTGLDDPNNVGAWQGIFAQKNQLGMATVLAMAVALGIRSRTQTDRFWKTLVIVSALIAAVGSQSREAWVSIISQITLFAFLAVFRRFRPRSQLILAASGMVLAGAAAISVYTHIDAVLALLGRSRTASGRTYIWQGALLLIHKRPWLGYGAYGIWHTPIATEIIARAGWNVTSSHNNYLEILLYYGIVGLSLYLLLLVLFFGYIIRALLVGHMGEIVPGALVITGIVVLSFASPLTVYFPSAAFLLLTFYCALLERTLRNTTWSHADRLLHRARPVRANSI